MPVKKVSIEPSVVSSACSALKIGAEQTSKTGKVSTSLCIMNAINIVCLIGYFNVLESHVLLIKSRRRINKQLINHNLSH